MYNILLVEDEKSIRENIQKGILWEKYGFHIAAEAANGERALELIEKVHPDILLTDIRMPFMDGMELSRIVHQLFPDIKIVILSGYMEFGYAREAISLGVEEYLVKPITPVKIIRTFTSLKEKMDEEIRESQRYASLVKEVRSLEERLESKSVSKLSPKDLNNDAQRENNLWTFLQTGTLETIDAFTEQYIKSCEENLLKSLLYCSYFFVQTLVTCMKVVETIGGDPSEIFSNLQDVDDYVSKITSARKAKEEIKTILYKVLVFRNQTVDRSSEIIRNAKLYLQEHYLEPGLAVGDVADYVGLSASHFSYIFKQKTGSGVTKYLTSIRIEKAKELLKSTSMTAAEVSEAVGYNNANYFSSVFHKYVGMTTKEYRDS